MNIITHNYILERGDCLGNCSKDHFREIQQSLVKTKLYQVKLGDTIAALSRRFNVSVASLAAVNPSLNYNFLRLGQSLYLPKQEELGYSEMSYYRIKDGETLPSIAQKFNVKLDQLREVNPLLDEAELEVNQLILIPLLPSNPFCSKDSIIYIVKYRDSFESIAKKYNLSLSNLKEANPNIDPEALLLGQKICLPI